MIINILSFLVLVLLVLLFAWLTRRAWGSRNAILKWLGGLLAGLLTLILALVTIVAAIGLFKLYWPQTNPVSSIHVASTPDQVARGEKIANICAGCHSTTGQPPLDGGSSNFAGPLGSIYPPNLTPYGPLKGWSDGELIRAIREGVHQTGRPLIVMPSDQFHILSDADVQSIVAYVRSQPPVPHDTPDVDLNLLGAVLVGAGIFTTSQQPPITQPVAAPPSGTADYGKYLVDLSGCRVCHGPDLAGGKPGGFTPVGPNLTVLIPKWSQADFLKEFRQGVDPTGHILTDAMPWKQFSEAYNDVELGDMFSYLHGLVPLQK